MYRLVWALSVQKCDSKHESGSLSCIYNYFSHISILRAAWICVSSLNKGNIWNSQAMCHSMKQDFGVSGQIFHSHTPAAHGTTKPASGTLVNSLGKVQSLDEHKEQTELSDLKYLCRAAWESLEELRKCWAKSKEWSLIPCAIHSF